MNPQQDLLSEMNDLENFGYTIASRTERFFAAFIEGIIIYLPINLLLDYTGITSGLETYDLTSILIQTVIAIVLGGIFYSQWSGNLGHKIFGLKVISAKDGSEQKEFKMGALREAIKSILCMFLIPAIWLLWDKKKQNLYDKVVDTLVVKVR